MNDYLYLPEWKDTRPIYRKLSDEFAVLTDAYSITINERSKLMLDHLILGIDEVDLVVDPLPTKIERVTLTNSILNFLINDSTTWVHELATPSLQIKIQQIKLIAKELNVTDRFHAAASQIFEFTKRKRHVLDESELIHLIQLEGRATAELPLSFMQISADHSFAQFFSNLCMLMGIADLVVDARTDYKADYIAINPTLSLYSKLNYVVIKEGIKLVWNFPRKIQFIIYCIKFSILLFTSKE